MIEAARNLTYLSGKGVKLINEYIIRPSIPNIRVPEISDLKTELIKVGGETIFIPATEMAIKLGDPIYTNIIILGGLTALSLIEGLTYRDIVDTLKNLRRYKENLEAFKLGYRYVTSVGRRKIINHKGKEIS